MQPDWLPFKYLSDKLINTQGKNVYLEFDLGMHIVPKVVPR
jgi:hypothetical protein